MNEIHQTIKAGAESICPDCAHYYVCPAVDNQPCIQCDQYMYLPPVRIGFWKATTRRNTPYTECSYCHAVTRSQFVKSWKFCPNCGAAMMEDAE